MFSHKKNAFSLAEMMVVMLILSLVMAASLPIITRRSSSGESAGGSSIWKWATNDLDTYFGTDANQAAIIGATSTGTISNNTRLLLSTSTTDSNQYHILFKSGDTETGHLIVNSNNSIGLGKATLGASAASAIAIGSDTRATQNNTIAIGISDAAKGATEPGAIGIGSGVQAAARQSVAIGAGAHTVENGTLFGGIALGYGASTYCNNIAIGNGALADTTGATETISIGVGATSTVTGGVAIGAGASATGNSTALGTGSKALGSNTAAIGYNASASGSNNIQLGNSSVTKINYYGVLTNVSDKRLKNIGSEYVGGLDRIRLLTPYNFTFKKDTEKTPQVGVMAQDLQKVFPDAVSKNSDGYLIIRKEDMFYAVINAVKELDKITQGLQNDIKTIFAKIQKLDDKIAAIIKVDQITSQKIKSLEAENKRLKLQNKSFEARLSRLEKHSHK